MAFHSGEITFTTLSTTKKASRSKNFCSDMQSASANGRSQRDSTCIGGTETCSPGATTGDDSDCDNVDDDCDTVADNHYAPYTCGEGVCQRSSICAGGAESCTAGSPGPTGWTWSSRPRPLRVVRSAT